MDVDAAPAGLDDIATIADLAATAEEELTPHRGGAMWRRREARPGPHDVALRKLSDDPERHLVLVGRIDGATVGYAAASLLELHDGSSVADLTDIYVLPEARGVGVGEALMDAVMAWARATGCVGVDAIALPGDRETKNFFETFGLVARALRVHKSIG